MQTQVHAKQTCVSMPAKQPWDHIDIQPTGNCKDLCIQTVELCIIFCVAELLHSISFPGKIFSPIQKSVPKLSFKCVKIRPNLMIFACFVHTFFAPPQKKNFCSTPFAPPSTKSNFYLVGGLGAESHQYFEWGGAWSILEPQENLISL